MEPTALTLEGWLEPDVTGYEANFHIDEGYSALLHRAVESGQPRHSPQSTAAAN